MRVRPCIVGSLLVAALVAQSHADWEFFSGPEGSSLQGVIYHDGRLFAGSSFFDVKYSDDLGDSWQLIQPSNVPPNRYHRGLAFGPRLFVTTTDGKVFASLDKGESWIEKTNGLESGLVRSSVSGSGTTLYLGADGRLYKSTDYGDSWTALDTNGLGRMRITVVCESGSRLIANGYNDYRAEWAPLYSDDGGMNWNAATVSSESGERSFNQIFVHNGRVYAMAFRHIFISQDNGASYQQVERRLYNGTMTLVNGRILVTCTESGLLEMSADGSTFTERNTGLRTMNVRGLASSGSAFFLGAKLGVYRTDDITGTWTLANKGIGTSSVWSIVEKDNALFIGTAFGVWKSTTNGVRWVPTGIADEAVHGLVVAGNNLYAAGDYVYVSSNNGETWSRAGSGFPEDVTAPLRLETVGNKLFLAAQQGSGRGLYVLNNFTGSWQDVSAVSELVIGMKAIGSDLYVAHMRGADNGASWSSLSGFSGETVYAFAENDGAIYAGAYRGAGAGRHSMYRSTNGTSFSAFTTGMPTSDDIHAFAFAVTGDTVFTVVGSDTHAGHRLRGYMTTTGSDTWTTVGSRFASACNYGCMLLNEYGILFGNDQGLYRYAFETLPDVPDTADRIEYPPLTVHNGPAPAQRVASPRASFDRDGANIRISFAAPRAGTAVIHLFSIEGRLVTRHTVPVAAAGVHRTSIGTSELAPGFYVCRLSGCELSASAPLFVTKR